MYNQFSRQIAKTGNIQQFIFNIFFCVHMETVNDLKKLLDLNLKDLTFSASEQDLNAINQKSKKLNNAINICIKSDNHSGQMSTMGIKNENEIKFRNYYDYNSKITREKPTKPIGVNVKKNFLKKGDGLKRFNLNRQDNIFINEKTDIKYCDSSNRNDRKIVSFANEDMQEKIINKNLGEKESLENECPNINNIDQSIYFHFFKYFKHFFFLLNFR